MVPPTMVVVVRGMGAGSRMGSCPSVTSAPEVAELSRMSVLGCAWGIGVGVAVGSGVPVLSMPLLFSSADFCSAALWSAAFCSADFWTVEFVSALVFFWLGRRRLGWACLAGRRGLVCRFCLVRRLWLFGQRRLPRSRSGNGGCDGAVFGTGDCGTPEPGFGVAGLSCVQPQRPNIITRKKSDALGERYIEFKGLRKLVLNNKALNNHLDANSSNSDGRQP